MPSPRPLLLRFALAFPAMLLFLAICFVTLGWALRSHQSLLIKRLGYNTTYRLTAFYLRFAAALDSADTDADGVRDGAEMYFGTGPRDPRRHPPLTVCLDPDGYAADEGVTSPPDPLVHVATQTASVAPGERYRWHGRVYTWEAQLGTPRGFRLRIIPPAGGETALPEGELTPHPLLVPVATDGSFVFDLRVPPPAEADITLARNATLKETSADIPEGPEGRPMRALLLRRQNLSALSTRFRAENAATNEALGNLTILRVWLASPIVLDAATEIVGKRTRHARFYQVNFPAVVPGEDQYFLLESTRPQSSAPWEPFRIIEAAELARPTTITVCQTPNITALEGYLGLLQFRLVPMTVLPPERPPH